MSKIAELDQLPFHYIILKITSLCNLACDYCHAGNLPTRTKLMPIHLISRILDDFSSSSDRDQLQLVFHGGEPLLAGLTFFKKILALEAQAKTSNLRITHGIQTNGTLITDEWIDLFQEGQFKVGLSIDGPPALHDKHRKDKTGQPTFDRVASAMDKLQENRIPFSLLSVITKESPFYVGSFFDLLLEWEMSGIDFLPCVGSTAYKHVHAYSEFMNAAFDIWLSHDMPFQVRTFLAILRSLKGENGRLCQFTETCGEVLAINALGRIYPCDRFIGDENYLIGKVHSSSIELVDSPPIILEKKMPSSCTACKVSQVCNNGCPARADPKSGRDIFCSARKKIIQHIQGSLDEHGLSPTDILGKFDQQSFQWTDSIT